MPPDPASRRASRSTVALGACVTALALEARASVASGQPGQRLTFDLGGATLDQANAASVTAPTLAANWRLGSDRALLDLSGAATLAAADRWAAQGVVAGAWTPGTTGAWEIGGVATGLRYRGADPSGHVLVLARRRLQGDRWGGWAGVGGGYLGRQRLHAPILAADAGVWWRRSTGPTFSLAVTGQRARLDSVARGTMTFGVPTLAPVAVPVSVAGGGGAVSVGARPLLATDLTGAVEWRAARGEVAASAGVRRAPMQFAGVRPVLLASAVWWTFPRVGLVASAGDQVGDPLRGMPGVRHLSLGVRWRVAPVRDAERARPVAARAPEPGRDAPVVEAIYAGRGAALRVRALDADRVDVRGDWTSWRPVAMARAADAWVLADPVPRGTRRLTVRVNGGAWQVPANLPGADDDFGSRVGLLIVP